MVGSGGHPEVSIIIPSWTGEVSRVMRSIERQTFKDYEVEVVSGISPAARARNVGVARTRGRVLLFIDDDAFLGHEKVLSNLVSALESDERIGVVGTSKLVPKSANRLQRAIAKQVPRMVYPVVTRSIESNPPLSSYGFTAVTTTCCAVRRNVFEEVGGFDEELTTGPEDTDFFYRVRRAGYKIEVASHSWVYHDPPSSIGDLLRKSFSYGMGHALEARKSPERRMDVLPLGKWYGKLALLGSLLAFPAALFVHYYFDPVRRVEFGFRPLKTLSTYAVLCGYVVGWYRGKPEGAATTYMGRKGAPQRRVVEAGRAPARVLYVDAYPKIGGGQRSLMYIVSQLALDRYRPVVALRAQHPLQSQLDSAGVETAHISFTESNYTLPRLSRPLSILGAAVSVVRVVLEIRELARREKVDLIHANSAVAGVHALPAAMSLGIPCVVHARDFLTSDLTNRILKLLLRYKASELVFVSRSIATHYGAGKGSKYRHRIIYNAVDASAFRPDHEAGARFRAEHGLPADCFLIGAVGQIEPWKGFGLLLDAFAVVAARYPNARLVIAGEESAGPFKEAKQQLLQQVHSLGLDGKVLFTGFLQDVAPFMQAIDVLAHSPVLPEPFGRVLIEAMACGAPIVSVRAGGIPEVVIDRENGFLVAPGDEAALAAALCELAANPDLGRELGEAGRHMVEARFSVEKQAQEIERLYDLLLAEGRPESTAAEPTPTFMRST